jgi:probable aminopeptidase NPEPL1
MMLKFLSQRRGVVLRCTQLLCLTRTASSFSGSIFPHPPIRAFSSTTCRLATVATTPDTATTIDTTTTDTLNFGSSFEPVADYNSTLVIGKKSSLTELLPNLVESLGLATLATPILDALTTSINEETGGSSSTLMVTNDDQKVVHKVSIGGLPSKLSRHNHPMAVHSLTQLAKACKGNTRIVVLTDGHPIAPLALALAKAFPVFTLKSKPSKGRNISIVFCQSDGTLVDGKPELAAAKAAAAGVQLAARLVDSHPELLTTTQFAKEVESLVANHPKVQMKQIIGEDLRKYGGLYGVGKAATCPPRLILLEYDGAGDENDETIAFVGKVSSRNHGDRNGFDESIQ